MKGGIKMLSQELSNITKVIETSSTKEVNTFLNQGWQLIDTYTTTFSAETTDQVIMYVLGKSKD